MKIIPVIFLLISNFCYSQIYYPETNFNYYYINGFNAKEERQNHIVYLVEHKKDTLIFEKFISNNNIDTLYSFSMEHNSKVSDTTIFIYDTLGRKTKVEKRRKIKKLTFVSKFYKDSIVITYYTDEHFDGWTSAQFRNNILYRMDDYSRDSVLTETTYYFFRLTSFTSSKIQKETKNKYRVIVRDTIENKITTMLYLGENLKKPIEEIEYYYDNCCLSYSISKYNGKINEFSKYKFIDNRLFNQFIFFDTEDQSYFYYTYF